MSDEQKPSAQASIAREISIVCRCKAVKYRAIREAIVKGAHTIEAVRQQTRANTGCGKACTEKIHEMIELYATRSN